MIISESDSVASNNERKRCRGIKNKKNKNPYQWTLEDYVSPTLTAAEDPARDRLGEPGTKRSTGVIPKRKKSSMVRERSRAHVTDYGKLRSSTPIQTSAPQLHATGIMFGGLAPISHDPQLDPPEM